MAALWGGHEECLICVANMGKLPNLCHDLQVRGLCSALEGYRGRLLEVSVPQADAGTTVRIQLDRCQEGKLDSETWCRKLITELCQQIDMTPLAGPFSETLFHPTDPTLSGVSSVLIIQESHIAIHTWPEDSAIRAVIDTCGEGLSVGQMAAWLMKRVGARTSRVFVSRLYEHTIYQ